MRSPALFVLPLALVLALAGCTTEPDPEPSPTPTGFATEDEAFAAAEETFDGYIQASNDAVLGEPDSIEPVYSWLSGDALDAAREEFTMMTAAHWVKSGEALITSVKPVRYEGNVTADFCVDVSDVDVVDQDGESVVGQDRGDVQELRVVFEKSRATTTGLVISVIGAPPSPGRCVA